MPALSARFDPDSTRGRKDFFDIRTRLVVSLVVTTATIYLESAPVLWTMAALSFLYLLQTRRYVIIAVAYLFMLVMTVISVAVIYGTFGLFEWLGAGTKVAEFAAMMKTALLSNFATPFLRSIPSMNVLIAIGINFSVQGFVGTMKSLHLPRFLFLPLMVFCRFIPEFFDVIRQLRDAVRMRGFSVGFGSAFIHPLQTIRLTVIPLVVRTLRMADNLSMAAEMKRVGYAKKPTHLNKLRFRGWDYALMAATLVLSLALCFWESTIPKSPRMGMGRRPKMSQTSSPSSGVAPSSPSSASSPSTAPTTARKEAEQ